MTKIRGILKSWTDSDIHKLTLWYPNVSTAEIAERLGCSLSRVYCKASKLGLKKSADYTAHQIDRCRMMLASLGKENRFQPGLTPWNKGTKGSTIGIATRFKAGQVPHNNAEIGAYRITMHKEGRGGGILQRKVGNTKGSPTRRWRSVHELVWVEANGPVPERHICVFKRGMRTVVLEEITLDKIECISLSEHMRRNMYHNYGKEVAQLIQLRGAITKKINKLEEGKK